MGPASRRTLASVKLDMEVHIVIFPAQRAYGEENVSIIANAKTILPVILLTATAAVPGVGRGISASTNAWKELTVRIV